MNTYKSKSSLIEVITFDELIAHGKTQVEADHLVNGMPWSFEYKGHPLTHENDNEYLLQPTVGAAISICRGSLICTDSMGNLWQSTKEALESGYEKVLLKVGQIVTYHPSVEEIDRLAISGNITPELPAIITNVFTEDCVNLRVIADGEKEGDFWVNSVNRLVNMEDTGVFTI